MDRIVNRIIYIFFAIVCSLGDTMGMSGKCGDLLYSVDVENATITLSGNGYAEDFTQYGAPWYSVRHKIKTVIIEEGVKNVPAHGFEVMSQLKKVVLPSSLERIGDYAFWACIRLNDVNFDEIKNVVYGSHSFSSCKAIESVALNGAEKVSEFCFEDCKRLKKLDIGNDCREIGKCAFYGCDSLISVRISDSLTVIGDSAFLNCYSLEKFDFPQTTKRIGNFAFENCYSLKSIELKDNVEYLGYYSFSFCEGLKSANLQKAKIDSIRNSTFDGCKELQNVVFPSNLAYVGVAGFRNCEKLEEIEIPKHTKYLSEDAFFQCYSLKRVVLPDSLEIIGLKCFNSCRSLEEFTIPLHIKLLGSDFLGITPSLKRLYHLSPELHDVRHYDIESILPQRVTLYVKKGNKKKIKDTWWKHFTMIEELK